MEKNKNSKDIESPLSMQPTKRKNLITWSVLIVSLLLFILVLILFYFHNPIFQNKPIISIKGWHTYKNPDGLYSIEYPSYMDYHYGESSHASCATQLILIDVAKEDILENSAHGFSTNDLVGNVVIDACKWQKPINPLKGDTLYVRGEKPNVISINGHIGYEAKGFTDHSGVGYALRYSFNVERSVVYKDGIEYSIDFRYSLPKNGKMPDNSQEIFETYRKIISTINFKIPIN